MASKAKGRVAGVDTQPRVLVVDNDESMRRALTRTLRLAGFEVEAFRYVEALLARGIFGHDVCLVLDVDSPGIEGRALAQNLRAMKRCIATIFVTALGPDEVAVRFEGLSPLAVLCKPFNKEDLLDAVGRAQRSLN